MEGSLQQSNRVKLLCACCGVKGFNKDEAGGANGERTSFNVVRQ